MSVTVVAPPVAPARPELDEWTPEEAASNGAVFLDEQRPGWAHEIDADTLQLSDSCGCVLGQLYGRYAIGCETWDLGHPEGDRVVRLGFNTPCDENCGEYGVLTEAWRGEIARRVSP